LLCFCSSGTRGCRGRRGAPRSSCRPCSPLGCRPADARNRFVGGSRPFIAELG
jgi:hypothetical protein